MPEELKSLDREVQKKILRIYYDKWRDFSRWFEAGTMEIEGVEKKGILTNAEYLAKQGLIERARTSSFLSEITVFGIDSIEDKRISEDVEIRRKILAILFEEFKKEMGRRVAKKTLVKKSGCSSVEIDRNLWYLEHIGMVEAQWFAGGGAFTAEITGMGMEALKEPSVLEQEVKFMSNAYSILFELENGLRAFIEKRLREEYNEEWWQKGVPLRVRRNAEQNRAKEPDSSLSLLHFTEFSDLRRIVQKEDNWHGIFKRYFKTLEQVISRLDELEDIRHPIAHTRLISNDDFEKLDLFNREIKKMIG